MSPTVDDVLTLLETRGHSDYGGEQVTQLEHALQAARLAEEEQASPPLIAAALLHDVGHLLHDLPPEAPERGVDDRHEAAGGRWLEGLFPPSVTEPIRLHVPAKRCLCATDPAYRGALSEPSMVSLRLQGGPMSEREAERFMVLPFAADALRLRRWDDAAKTPGLPTPPLSHFADCLRQAARPAEGGDA